MTSRGGQRARDDGAPLVAVAGRRSGAAGGAQRRMPGAVSPCVRPRGDTIASAPPLLVGVARAVGVACRRTPCGGCPPRRSACSTPASRRRRAGSSCARGACTIAAARRARVFRRRRRRAPSRVACWCTAGTSRAAGRAPRAWCSARPSPASNRSRPARWLRSKRPPIAMPTRCARAGRTRPASGASCCSPRQRRRPPSARTTARRRSAPCRGNTRGACSLTHFRTRRSMKKRACE